VLDRVFGYPTERDWKRSALLEPRVLAGEPELLSDGSGLAFARSALDAPDGELPAGDPAVEALVAQLARQKSVGDGPAQAGLDGWRLLARTDDEALFGHGLPPRMVTVTMRQGSGRHPWSSVAVTKAEPLRASRDGVRASGWRLDPSYDPEPQDTIIRVLVTEQTRAGGKRADGRLLAPDLHVTDEELILTMFVSPLNGFYLAASVPETVARVALPVAIGQRRLIDGALYDSSGLDDPTRHSPTST
jgi:hypothetical protein